MLLMGLGGLPQKKGDGGGEIGRETALGEAHGGIYVRPAATQSVLLRRVLSSWIPCCHPPSLNFQQAVR